MTSPSPPATWSTTCGSTRRSRRASVGACAQVGQDHRVVGFVAPVQAPGTGAVVVVGHRDQRAGGHARAVGGEHRAAEGNARPDGRVGRHYLEQGSGAVFLLGADREVDSPCCVREAQVRCGHGDLLSARTGTAQRRPRGGVRETLQSCSRGCWQRQRSLWHPSWPPSRVRSFGPGWQRLRRPALEPSMGRCGGGQAWLLSLSEAPVLAGFSAAWPLTWR